MQLLEERFFGQQTRTLSLSTKEKHIHESSRHWNGNPRLSGKG